MKYLGIFTTVSNCLSIALLWVVICVYFLKQSVREKIPFTVPNLSFALVLSQILFQVSWNHTALPLQMSWNSGKIFQYLLQKCWFDSVQNVCARLLCCPVNFFLVLGQHHRSNPFQPGSLLYDGNAASLLLADDFSYYDLHLNRTHVSFFKYLQALVPQERLC